MGKQILISIVAAVLASLATCLIVFSLGLDGRHETSQRMKDLEADVSTSVRESDAKVDTALRRIDRATDEARAARQDAAAARAAVGAPAAEGDTPMQSPDGTAYMSRAEVDKLLAERLAGVATGENRFATPDPPKSIGEIADDMHLSANQEATLDVVLRESEEEMLQIFFGDMRIAEIRDVVQRAKDDPDEQARLVQTFATRAFANLGKIATYENRVKKRVEDVLGKELAKDFLGRPRKPALGEDFEDIFEDIFD